MQAFCGEKQRCAYAGSVGPYIHILPRLGELLIFRLRELQIHIYELPEAAGLGFGGDRFDRWLVSLFVSPLLVYSELHHELPMGNYFN